MRLFVAIDLDDAAREAAAQYAQEARRRLESVPASWTRRDNMHLTLRFIGEVDEAQASRIRTVLQPAVGVEPATLRLDRAGLFPPSGNPRVLWLGVRDPAAMLRRAHGIVEDRLGEVGLERESRAYTAHLTLARFRDSRGAGRQIRTTLDAMAAPDARWTADRVTLYQSRPSPKGSVYTALLHAPLRQNA